jgi:hypothetical protein
VNCLISVLLIISFIIFCVVSVLFLIKINRNTKPSDIPSDAIPVTGSNFVYMWLWKKENKINFVFSNLPHVTISFDERVKQNFIDALKKIN